MAIHLDQPIPASSADPRRWWSVVAALVILALFAQAIFAGAMLSGFEWARAAHAANALVVIAATAMANIVALVTLRHVANGWKFGLTLLALAAAVFVQFALGRMAANGANLMWVHVPLGVALVALAGQAARAARKLGETP